MYMASLKLEIIMQKLFKVLKPEYLVKSSINNNSMLE